MARAGNANADIWPTTKAATKSQCPRMLSYLIRVMAMAGNVTVASRPKATLANPLMFPRTHTLDTPATPGNAQRHTDASAKSVKFSNTKIVVLGETWDLISFKKLSVFVCSGSRHSPG